MAFSESPHVLRPELAVGDIHAAVDRVIAWHGTYIPMELLLETGLLRFTDYEAWRRGQRHTLGSLLTDETKRVIPLLRQAARWADTLGFEPVARDYFGWGEHADQRLVLFDPDDNDADALLATHYVRRNAPTSGDQLDLFFDGHVTVMVRKLASALRARNADAARHGLAMLEKHAPRHDLLPAARRLVDTLHDLPKPVAAQEAPAELAMIEQQLAPAAQAVLGPAARDLMVTFWQRLALALADTPFDPAQPTLHASYAHIQCLDWHKAVAAIEAVPDYTNHSMLLTRLATAHYHNGNHNAAITAWSRLCWHDERMATTALDGLPASATYLRRLWYEFGSLDQDPAPDVRQFPAYLLVAERGLVHVIPATTNGAPAEPAFLAMRDLLLHDDIDCRRAVAAAAPWLLDIYLALHGPR